MNRSILLAAVAGGALAAQAALGQTLLPRAESTPPPTGGSSAGELAPAVDAPRGGYLGFVPDEHYAGRGVRIESVKAGAPAAQGGLKDGDLITAVDGKPVANLTEFDFLLDRTNPGQKLQVSVDRAGRSQQLTVTLGAKSGTPAPTSEPSPTETPLRSPLAAPGSSALPSGSFSAPSSTPGTASSPALSPPANPGIPDATAPSLTPPATSESLPGASALAPSTTSESPPRSIRAQPLDIGPPPRTAAEPDDSGSRSPAPSGAASGRASLGISVLEVSDEARLEAGAPSRRGALITNVKRGSPAELAGLPTGGVIVRLDSREVTSPDDVVSAVQAAQPGQEVEVTYFDRGRLFRKLVRLAGAGEDVAGESSRSHSAAGPPASGSAGGGGYVRGAPGAIGNRPLLRNLGQMAADTIGRPGGLSTVYDPSVVAALQDRVAELTAQTRQLEERISQLESKIGGTTGASAPASTTPAPPAGSALPAGPSFGAPTGPGFGPAFGGTGTTP